jgi:hypothetical protein
VGVNKLLKEASQNLFVYSPQVIDCRILDTMQIERQGYKNIKVSLIDIRASASQLLASPQHQERWQLFICPDSFDGAI